jgi:hypothetical protein
MANSVNPAKCVILRRNDEGSPQSRTLPNNKSSFINNNSPHSVILTTKEEGSLQSRTVPNNKSSFINNNSPHGVILSASEGSPQTCTAPTNNKSSLINNNSLNLPITLISYSLSHKIVNQLRLYLYLKIISSGHFKITKDTVSHICKTLDYYSDKTFFKNLNWLVLNRWITFNPNSGNCRVISFTRLCYKLKIRTRTGVKFDILDFKYFRPFLYAAIIAWGIRYRAWCQRARAERQPGRKKGRSIVGMSLPNRYLAKILDLDHSTISRYKSSASAAGYITSSHCYEDTGLSPKFLYPMQKYLPEEAHLFVTHDGTLCRQLPDKITNTIHLKHRRPRPP